VPGSGALVASAPLPPLVSVRCTVQLPEADEDAEAEEEVEAVGQSASDAVSAHDGFARSSGSGEAAASEAQPDRSGSSSSRWGRGRSSGDSRTLDAAVPPNRHVGLLQCSVKLPAHALLALRRLPAQGGGAARGGDGGDAGSGRRGGGVMMHQQGLVFAGGSSEDEAPLAGFDRLLAAAQGVVAAAHAAYDAAASERLGCVGAVVPV